MDHTVASSVRKSTLTIVIIFASTYSWYESCIRVSSKFVLGKSKTYNFSIISLKELQISNSFVTRHSYFVLIL